MKKIKNNKIIDLRNKKENEKIVELGKVSQKINTIFQINMKNKQQ